MDDHSTTLFRFACPHCRGRLKARPEAVGKAARCHHCDRHLRVPMPAATVIEWEPGVGPPPGPAPEAVVYPDEPFPGESSPVARRRGSPVVGGILLAAGIVLILTAVGTFLEERTATALMRARAEGLISAHADELGARIMRGDAHAREAAGVWVLLVGGGAGVACLAAFAARLLR